MTKEATADLTSGRVLKTFEAVLERMEVEADASAYAKNTDYRIHCQGNNHFGLVFVVLLSSIIFSIYFYICPPEPEMDLVDKSQVISAILTFGGLFAAVFIPIWQFLVAGRISRLERTRSFWESHRNDNDFMDKRTIVQQHFGGNPNVQSIIKDKEKLRDVQSVCNFYERLAGGIKKGYYDEEESADYFKKRLTEDHPSAQYYINIGEINNKNVLNRLLIMKISSGWKNVGGIHKRR